MRHRLHVLLFSLLTCLACTELGPQCLDGKDNDFDGLTDCEDDSCSRTAFCPGCGNGNLEEGEDCEANNLQDQSCETLGEDTGELRCGSDCHFDISGCKAICGNGVEGGPEECDDNNILANDGCGPSCLLEFCQDGMLQDKLGEQCDDGNAAVDDGCDPTCRIEFCGDGILHPSLEEACDDGNNLSGDGCDATCVVEFCGDGIVQPFLLEGCDDGGNLAGDGCAPDCLSESCGNGTIESEFGEVCDDGNRAFEDGCRGDCLGVEVCRDHLVDVGEECDDGNAAPADGCSVICQQETFLDEIEPNNNAVQADSQASQEVLIRENVFLRGAITKDTDAKDVYRVEVAVPSVLRFELFDQAKKTDCLLGNSSKLLLFNSNNNLLAENNSGGINTCAALVVKVNAGTFYVQVEELGNDADLPFYLLEASFAESQGNEVEDNASIDTADVLGESDTFFVTGAVLGFIDPDLFRITVPDGASVRAQIIEGNGTARCNNGTIDSVLTLLNLAGDELASNDDAEFLCSRLDGTGETPKDIGAHDLPGGDYIVKVSGPNVVGFFDYTLVITVRAP